MTIIKELHEAEIVLRTKMNVADAHRTIAESGDDTVAIKKANDAYSEALQEWCAAYDATAAAARAQVVALGLDPAVLASILARK